MMSVTVTVTVDPAAPAGIGKLELPVMSKVEGVPPGRRYPPSWDTRLSEPPLALTVTVPPVAAGTVGVFRETVTGPIRVRDAAALTLPFAAELTLTVRVAPVFPTVVILFCHITLKTVLPRCVSGMVILVSPVTSPALTVTVIVLPAVIGLPFWSDTVYMKD